MDEEKHLDQLKAERYAMAKRWVDRACSEIGTVPSVVAMDVRFHYDDGAILELQCRDRIDLE